MSVTRTRGAALTALAAGTAIVLAGCATAGSTEAGPGGDDTNTSSEGPITIGYIGALSGGSASLGVPIQHGIELAIEQINDSGDLDREIKLVAVDDEADATKSASAAQRMVTEDGVIAVLGGPNSGTVLANNPIITGAGVVQLITVAQGDNLIDPANAGHDLTFQVTENNSYDVGAIVQLFEDGDFENICAVSDTTEYGQGGIATIRKVFEARNLEVATAVSHEVNATDLTPQVLSLRDAKCDAVYLFDYGQDAALFMKTVNQVGWEVPVIGGRGLNQAAFLSIAGEAGDGIIFPSVIDPEKKSAQEFIEAYDEKYGEDDDPAHTFSALGYDSVKLLIEGLKGSDFEGGEALAEALAEVTLKDAASGKEDSTLSYTFGDHRAPSDNFLTFWTIENGKYELYSRDVASTRP